MTQPEAGSPKAYAINGRACGLQEFTQTACDPLRSVVVEACAGAGKTHLLVTRMLRALAAPPEQGGAQPQEILAITFTKKAAGEMRQRLFDWLSLPQHHATYAKVLASGKTVEIRTFHSWFASLLRMAPLAVLDTLGLPAGFELVEDDTALLDGAWRPFYETVQNDAQLLADLTEVVASSGRHSALAWLTAAWRKRAEFSAADRLGHVLSSVPPVQGGARPDAAHPDREFWASSITQTVLADAAKALCGGTTRLITQGKLLQAALTIAGAEAGIDSGTDSGTDSGSASGIDAAHAALFTKSEPQPPRKLGNHPDVLAAQDMLAQHLQTRLLWNAWRMQQCMTRLTRALLDAYGDHKRKQGVIDMGDVERAASHILADDVVGGWMQQRLDARIRHVMVDEFQDTNPVQWQALQAWLSGYAVGLASNDISVFLVGDPKQSIYRFRGAQTGVFAAATRFVCEGLKGDLLTADHTWRCSQSVASVLNAAFSPLAETGEMPDFRVHTSQSDEQGAVQMLPLIAKGGRTGKADASEPDADRASEGDAESADGIANGTWRDTLRTPRELPASEKHSEAFDAVAAWIAAEVASGLPAANLLVLARTRKSLGRLAPLLRQRGISFVQADSNPLRDACEVQDITALLDAMVSPSHNLSLARALKSPIFGWPDRALGALAVLAEQSGQHWLPQLLACAEDTPHILSQYLLQNKEQTNAVDVGQSANLLGETAKTLRLYAFWLANSPPHDALTRIYEHRDGHSPQMGALDGLNLLERFSAAVPSAQRDAVLANLQTVLSHALGVNGGRFLTPYALVRALKKPGLKAATAVGASTQSAPDAPRMPGAAEAVEVAAQPQQVRGMTVHKAKGLEAEVVLLLDADSEKRKAETFCVRVDWPAERSAPTRFVFLASTAKSPAHLQSVVAIEERAAGREALNVAYVALSRAKTRFVMSATEARAPDPFSAWRLFAAHADLLGAAQPSAALPVGLPEATGSKHPEPPMQNSALHAPVAQGHQSTGQFFLKKLPIVQHPRHLFAINFDSNQTSESDLSARMGRCMHRILQWNVPSQAGSTQRPGVDIQGAADDETVLAAARENGLTWAQACASAKRAQSILKGEGAWAWDPECIVQAFNELPIVVGGQDMRIDRLVQRTTGEWWVLDFKSAAEDRHGGEMQVRAYMQAVARLAAGARVRGALLLASGQMVEIEAQPALGT